jgi:hypothetical protein
MVTKHVQITEDNRRRRVFAVAKFAGNQRYPRTTTTTVRESLVLGRRSLGRRLSTSRRRSQWRLTASRCDGASATIDTTTTTSKAARTRERRRTRDTPVGIPAPVLGASRLGWAGVGSEDRVEAGQNRRHFYLGGEVRVTN